MTYEHLDGRLVNALLGDGRASLRSLAGDLDVSVTTVSNHLKGLEDRGVIGGYTPIVDYAALGYDVTAIVQLRVEGDSIVEMARRLGDRPELISVYEVTGDYDIIAIGKFRTTEEMNDGIKDLLTDDAVKATNTSVVLDSVSENAQFEVDVDV
ncbi:AsnC family transcriptional regulator [Halobacteriales archaeon SW_7_68_16]|nr:MAG: AsnC family transcriptional regulator [Halobacteriales archaeon SW_7_68_16]